MILYALKAFRAHFLRRTVYRTNNKIRRVEDCPLSCFLKSLYGHLSNETQEEIRNGFVRNVELQWLLEDIRPNYHKPFDFENKIERTTKTIQTLRFLLKMMI
jgi:hypothetical protein